VYARVTLPKGPWPGETRLQDQADAACTSKFAGWIGVSFDDSELDYATWTPYRESWEAGDRVVICTVMDPGTKTTGTLQGSKR
jgi:hypothetical protein